MTGTGHKIKSAASRRPGLVLEFIPGAEEFADRPSLGDAAAGAVRCVAVEYFCERAEAVGDHGVRERLQEREGGGAVFVNAMVRESERSEQPAPDDPLVISGVALATAAGIDTGIARFTRRKAAQSIRSQQVGCAGVNDSCLLFE